MNVPRLFVIGGSLLLLNAAVVLTTGMWRYVAADELQPAVHTSTATAQSATEPIQDSAGAPPASAASSSTDAAVQATGQAPVSPAASSNPLDRIPIPDSLPSIPSLGDHESLKDDPSFQEFSRLFSKVEESWEKDYPASVRPSAKVQSAAYFETLDQRLHSTEQLCTVARSIAAEAARQARSGRTKQSEELLQMATQLRDMAAKLLVVEL